MKAQYKITIINPDADPVIPTKVEAIKMLRLLAGTHTLGLKAGKEMIEFLMEEPHESLLLESDHYGDSAARNAIAQLAGSNVGVALIIDELLQQVKQAAFDALEMGDHVLSKDLIEVLIKHGGE